MADKPTWLIRMENGSVGEARTRSFLIDRFWILERSVDVDGADFIIQRQLTSHNLLDRSPPRFGVVQVKFYQSEKTTQYVHAEYVRDQRREPRNEFFVLCHTGREDDKRSFLLSAEDIMRGFELKGPGHSEEGKYALPGKDVLIGRFEIRSPARALDRIEHALNMADFRQNREFLSWASPSIRNRTDTIRPEYGAKIPNNWGEIPEGFKALKDEATSLSVNLSEALDMVDSILAADDPVKAMSIVEKLEDEYGRPLSFRSDLYNEDFHDAIEQRRLLYDSLRNAGLWDQFLTLQGECSRYVAVEVGRRMPLDTKTAFVMVLRYRPDTLTNHLLECWFDRVESLSPELLEKRDTWHDTRVGIVSAKAGEVIAYWIPGQYNFYSPRTRKRIEAGADWVKELESHVGELVKLVMDEVYKESFPQLTALKDDEVRDGVIKRVTPRGLYIDVGVGLDAFMRKSRCKRKRGYEGYEALYPVGDRIRVRIVNVELSTWQVDLDEVI
jgi:hypothetical protein